MAAHLDRIAKLNPTLNAIVAKLDDELTELWDAPVETVALRWGR